MGGGGNSCTRADGRTGQLKEVQEVLADLKITLHCNLDLAGGCCKMLLTYFEGVFFQMSMQMNQALA